MQVRLCLFLSPDILASVIKQKLEIDFNNSCLKRMTSRFNVMIVTSILILRKARVLTRMVTGLKEGNKMSSLKPTDKLHSAFKI